MRFRGQTIVVTGGGYGIGKQIALAFGAEGGDVVLGGRSVDKREAVADELRRLGTRPLVLPTDVTSEEQCRRLMAAAREQHGSLDVVVNNSGIGGPTALAGYAVERPPSPLLEHDRSGALPRANLSVKACAASATKAVSSVAAMAALPRPRRKALQRPRRIDGSKFPTTARRSILMPIFNSAIC